MESMENSLIKQNAILQEHLALLNYEVEALKKHLDNLEYIYTGDIESDSYQRNVNFEASPYPPYVCPGDSVIYYNGDSALQGIVESVDDNFVQIRVLDKYLNPTSSFIRLNAMQAPTVLRKVIHYGQN